MYLINLFRIDVIRVIDESELVDDFREESEAHDAPAYLQKIVDDIRNLEVVYFPGRDSESIHLSGWYAQVEVKRTLIDEFGWGTEEFREDDWRREGIAALPDVAVRPSTMFYTGSMTKSFTAAASSLLVDDDEKYPHIKWTTPLSELIRDDFVLQDEYATLHVTLED